MTTDDAIVFRGARQDRPGGGRYWQSFAVPHVPGMNVISALQSIAAHPVPLGAHERSSARRYRRSRPSNRLKFTHIFGSSR